MESGDDRGEIEGLWRRGAQAAERKISDDGGDETERADEKKTPRQPNRSPITPEIVAPIRLPVSATASRRPIATWR